MNKNILNYIEECEAWKVGIKNLHWSADNMSQHELCDDIADEISEFEDLVSEVEQSISGKIKLNGFTPKSYKITSLKSFVEDVISASQSFLKKLEGMGEKYVGIKSECETFIGTMQRKLYLVNFTLKEELKKRLRDKINESRPINMANATDSRTFMGRKPNRIIEGYRKEENIKTVFPGTKPTSDGGILKRLEAISSSKNGQFNSRTFDSMDDAFEFFQRNLERVGKLEYNGTVDDMLIVSLNADNGKTYKGMIDFIEVGDGKYKASIKFSNLGKESEFNEDFENNDYNDLRVENKQIKLTEDDFMRRWFDRNEEDHLDKVRKQIRDRDQEKLNPFRSNGGEVEEGISKNNQIRLTEAELKQVIEEATMKILSETPLNYDVDNFSGRWNKSEPDDEDRALGLSYISGDYLDDPFNAPNSWDDDDWVDGDKDMETDYSWDLHDWKPDYSSQIDREISRRNDKTNWTDRELRHGGRVMDKYVNGKYDGEDVGDAWDDLHYESKKPMKVTESELKTIVREAAIQIINEYNQRMANTKRFVRSTHGHGDSNKRKRKATPEERAEARRRLGIKEPSKVEEESIDIDPKNKGKFTATKKATGKSTEELTHSKNPLTRKRAIFAQNAKKWNHKK